MKGSFTKRGRQCDVTVTKTHLKCQLKNNLGPNVLLSLISSCPTVFGHPCTTYVEISLSDVLAIQTQARDNSEVSSVVVHYAGRKKNGRLTWEKLVLSGQPELCKELSNIFASTVPERQRSRHYLVIINPSSGKKKGSQLFHKMVAPLFRACGITFKIYHTSGPDDARNALQDVDFSSLDGVISVGGDGMYHEVVTALVLKQQQSLGADVDDPDTAVTSLPFPIGIIPAGSGNYVVQCLHGVVDPVTSAIKIVLAQTTPTSIASVHKGDKLLGFAGLMTSFGLIGDMMHACEKHRWMGNVRYKILPVKCMFNRRLVDAEVEFQKESSGEWHSVKGSFYIVESGMVNLANKGEKLVPVFGESALTLHMVSACPLSEHIKQLSKVQAWIAGAYDYPFIQSERVLRYRVNMSTLPSVQSDDGTRTLVDAYHMNLDGESFHMDRTDFHVGLHTGVVQLFG